MIDWFPGVFHLLADDRNTDLPQFYTQRHWRVHSGFRFHERKCFLFVQLAVDASACAYFSVQKCNHAIDVFSTLYSNGVVCSIVLHFALNVLAYSLLWFFSYFVSLQPAIKWMIPLVSKYVCVKAHCFQSYNIFSDLFQTTYPLPMQEK